MCFFSDTTQILSLNRSKVNDKGRHIGATEVRIVCVHRGSHSVAKTAKRVITIGVIAIGVQVVWVNGVWIQAIWVNA